MIPLGKLIAEPKEPIDWRPGLEKRASIGSRLFDH
jgi:hypothetical protein